MAVRLVLGAALCASGAALVGYFLLGIPLGVLLAATGGLAVAAWVLLWHRLPGPVRSAVAARARIGLLAGVPAIAAYDLSRWLLVEATGSTVRPFEAWRSFGELLGAGDRAGTAALVVGVLYHVVNGLGFAAAYGVVLADRGPLAGIAWALVLETFMVSFYPGWLGLAALEEFVSITVLGHLAYGATLGVLARRMVRRRAAAHPSPAVAAPGAPRDGAAPGGAP